MGGGIIGLVVIIVAVWFIVKEQNQNKQSNEANQNTKKSALNILEERYARGEIDEQEFEERKKNLQ